MKELSIPLLTEQDIDCRVQSVSKAKTGRVGAVLLLYKDARVDTAKKAFASTEAENPKAWPSNWLTR